MEQDTEMNDQMGSKTGFVGRWGKHVHVYWWELFFIDSAIYSSQSWKLDPIQPESDIPKGMP